MRIGFGFDVHAFGDNAKEDGFKLGGVRIPYTHGIVAHSDGDVLLHALCDALLGAAALGDLGKHYPNEDQYKGMAGREILKRTHSLIGKAGFDIVNVDATIVAEQPRLAPFVSEMCTFITSELDIASSCVNVKVTSTDGLGLIGRGEGIAAFAVVLLV